MHSLTAVKKQLMKEGLESFLRALNSHSFSPEEEQSLTRLSILIDGYPNLTLLSSLVEEVDVAKFIISRNPSLYSTAFN